MTKEFLESMGCEGERCETILAEHERSLEEHRKQTDALTLSLSTAQESLIALEAIRTAHESLSERIVARLIGEAHPTSQLAECAARQQLMASIGRGEDPYEALEALMAEDPEAFSPHHGDMPIFAVVSETEDPNAFNSLAIRRW